MKVCVHTCGVKPYVKSMYVQLVYMFFVFNNRSSCDESLCVLIYVNIARNLKLH